MRWTDHAEREVAFVVQRCEGTIQPISRIILDGAEVTSPAPSTTRSNQGKRTVTACTQCTRLGAVHVEPGYRILLLSKFRGDNIQIKLADRIVCATWAFV